MCATFTPTSSVNTEWLPDGLPLDAVDLHPRVLFDRMESRGGLRRLTFAPQDFWARFSPGHVDRLSLRVGQFVLPFGANPVMAPRRQFILPIEATDLGLKWDWGLDLKGPLGEHDWELGATIGSGEALRSPHLFGDPDRRSYLVSGRVGAPTCWETQYGASFLYGELPTIRGPMLVGSDSVSRWRVGFDGLRRHDEFWTSGAQLTYGQDGFRGDSALVMASGGERADVLGMRLFTDWVLENQPDNRYRAQYESVVRDLSTPDSDDTALVFEIERSLNTVSNLSLDLRWELNSAMGPENNALFLTCSLFAR